MICDLDQTLVDTRALRALREQRAWDRVYARIARCALVPGAYEFISRLGPIPIAVVTNSPAAYAERVLSSFSVRCDALVAYHDVRRHKPHPEPFRLALSILAVDARDVWSIGDHPDDIIGSRAAGIDATIGLSSASDDKAALLAAAPAVHAEDWNQVVSWMTGGSL